MSNVKEFQQLIQLVGQELAGLSPPISLEARADLADAAKTVGIEPDTVNPILALLDICNGQSGMSLFSYFNLCDASAIKSQLADFHSHGHCVVPFAWGCTKEYLLLDCGGTIGKPGNVIRWSIQNASGVVVAHDLDQFFQFTVDQATRLGEPEDGIGFLFDYPEISSE